MDPYTVYRKTKTKHGNEQAPADCYGKNAKIWLWLLAMCLAGAAVYAVVRASRPAVEATPAARLLSQIPGMEAQFIAMAPCPYCPGYLDEQGRCNVRECPIYSPNWGKGGTAAMKPAAARVQEPVQVKELAMEVLDLSGRGPVAVHAAYVGGTAEKAGLRKGDIVRRFNGRKVKDLPAFQDAVARAAPETTVKIEVIRNGERRQFPVMIGEGEMEGAVIPVAMNPTPTATQGRLF